jgi:hypothetical protein
MKTKKFSELVNDVLKVEDLSKVKGGVYQDDGCQTGICSKKINTSYCDGGAICTSGIAGSSVS